MRFSRTIILMAICAITLCGCGGSKIVCEIDGEHVPTSFTFKSFQKAAEKEHGTLEVQKDQFIKSKSVEVYFKKLDNGDLLVEKVVAMTTGEEWEPAVFFAVERH